jgi:hypothetical protein
MSDWYRQDFPDAPQGHALATDWNESQFLAWEDLGAWKVKRIDRNGFETPIVTVSDFATVREQVEKAKGAYANPVEPAEPPHARYLRAGVGALGGTVAGMLLGGLPGIIMKHSALAAVGAQVGGVVGAATGAVVADKLREDNPSPSISSLKSKLLR